MNILATHPLSFARTATLAGVARTQTRSFFWRSPRPSQARHQRKAPEKITVDLEISKLFKDQKLNQNYINEMIAKNLQSDLPKTIKVTDKSKSARDSSQTTTHTQPSTNNSNDFFLFYLLYLNSMNSHNSHVSYAYSDGLYDDRHRLNNDDYSHHHSNHDHSKHDHSKDDSQYSSSTNHDSSYTSHSSHSDSSYSHSTYDSTPTSSYDSSSSSSFDSGSSGGGDSG